MSDVPKYFLEFMAEKFKMLGDTSRLRILKSLMSREMNVTEIVEDTELSQANVSKHLRLLANAGLVQRRKSGLNAYYTVKDPVVERICDLVCRTILKEFDKGSSQVRYFKKKK